MNLFECQGGRERAGLRFAVADHAGDDQLRVVEYGPVGVGKAVAELTALVDRPRRLRRHVAADSARKGKLLEESAHAVDVLAFVRVNLGVGSLEVNRGQYARRAVTGAGHENHVQVVFANQPVAVHVGKTQRRRCAPVTQQAMLDLRGLQGFPQQRVRLQVNHAHGEVIAGAPVGVDQAQLFTVERSGRGLLRAVRIQDVILAVAVIRHRAATRPNVTQSM